MFSESTAKAQAIVLESHLGARLKVMEREDAAGDTMSIDRLSMICPSAARESLTNVFREKFESFASNFEKSFRGTLKTLRLINGSSTNDGGCCSSSLDVSTSDATSFEDALDPDVNHTHAETDGPCVGTQNVSSTSEERTSENFITKELALCI